MSKYVAGQKVIVPNGTCNWAVAELIEVVGENKNLASRPQLWSTRYGNHWSIDLDSYPRIVEREMNERARMLEEIKTK